MGYSEEYQKKLVSADEAVKAVKSGDWVDYGWCNGTPDALDAALAKRTDELTDVKVRGGILLKQPAIFEREDAGEHFTWNSWHMSGVERKLINRGCAYYAPIRYSELPRYYRELECRNAVAMFQVAPMDNHGYFNFGPNASHLARFALPSLNLFLFLFSFAPWNIFTPPILNDPQMTFTTNLSAAGPAPHFIPSLR